MRIKVTSSVAFLIPFIDYFVWGPLKYISCMFHLMSVTSDDRECND